MKKAENLYDKRLSLSFNFQAYSRCSWNTVFMPVFLLFLYSLQVGNCLLAIEYSRFSDLYNTQSTYKFMSELFKYCLFQRLSKNLGFHRKQRKMQIMYGNADDS